MIDKLENSQLCKLASQIATEAYGLLDDFPEEEKWGMQAKLRQQALNLTADLAEAEGSPDPRSRHYQLAMARRALFAIKSVYKLAHDTDILALRPETMVTIETLTKLLDEQIATFPQAVKAWDALMGPPKESKKS